MMAESTFLAAFDFAFRRIGSVELAEKILSHDSYSPVEQLYPEAVYYSATNNWPNILSKLLEKRVDVNAPIKGETPLSAACNEGYESVVSLLLDNGTDPSVPNKFSETPLHIAVSSRYDDDTSTAEMLLSAGANVNALDRDGATPLFLACERGKTEFVRLLLSRRANPNIAIEGQYTWYPIHEACTGLHYDVVRLLLDYNADVNVRDEFGETALHRVVSFGDTESDKSCCGLVQLLLDAGADVNAASIKGKTPLYIACSNGLDSTVMKMLERGAKVNGIDGKEKKRPLNAACRNQHMSVVQLLLTNGANPNPQEQGNANRYPSAGKPDESPLVEACHFQNVKLVNVLLKHGADPNLASMNSDCNPNLKYPLFVAVDRRNSDIITSLLNAGADVNAVNDEGESTVCFAAKNVINWTYGQSTEEMSSKLSTVRLLLEHGADVNVLMPDGHSPLYITVTALADGQRSGRKYVIELLQQIVKYGAELRDPSCRLGSLTLAALATFDVEDYFIVELFRAGAGLPLLARCCSPAGLTMFHRRTKSIRLCQATVLAGYVPSDEELQQLQLFAARDTSADHLIQQLVNWLNEDRQQVPSLQRRCRVVIRRQLSVAARFKSILPAIDKLPLPTILKLYLQFDGPLSEVDLNACTPTRP